MIVRPERDEDHEQIAAVVGAAFDGPEVPRLVEDLRASPGYVADLALVAVDDGDVVGHVLFTVTQLADGTPILMLSPLGVRPDRQRQGVGSALVHEGLRRLEGRPEPVVIVEGDPRYYSRFGFVRALELGLEPPHDRIPEHAFQALPLAGETPRGRVLYPPPFDGL